MPDPTAAHATHHELLIAAYAAGDATGAELEQAAALLSSCPECARLHRDLRALASALASAPAPARPRDFGITAAQAADLRRHRGWRRLLAPLAGARSAAGPVAASLAALGVAGLLLSGGLSGLPLGGAGTAALAPVPGGSQIVGAPISNGLDRNATGGEAAVPSAAASTAPQFAAGAPSAAPSAAAASAMAAASAPAASSASSGDSATAGPSASQGSVVTHGGPSAAAPSSAAGGSPKSGALSSQGPAGGPVTADSSSAAVLAPTAPPQTPGYVSAQSGAQASGPSLLVVVSVALLVVGVALGVVRLAARRLVP
ncbi:MAG TPA: hypothetical protein VIR16_01775 [Candidatus Limnocylindrales bacterium]